MIFVVNQKVILPKSHNEKEGIITVIPKSITAQSGLTQQVNRIKVSYVDGNGGMAEAWFKAESLKAWRAPKDITADLKKKHREEMEAVNAQNDREKLDWIESGNIDKTHIVKVKDGVLKDVIVPMDVDLDDKGFPIVEVTDEKEESVIEINKDTDIKEEMKQAEVKLNRRKDINSDDNSDSYIG